ncbi:hypothetical protein [Streptomyces sp. NPDC052192]
MSHSTTPGIWDARWCSVLTEQAAFPPNAEENLESVGNVDV